MLKKQLKRREKELIIGLFILIGVYFLVMGVVLTMGIYGNGLQEVFMAGTLFSMVLGLLLSSFIGPFSFLQEFNMAISMGQTRKRFVWHYELVSVLEFLAMAVLGKGFLVLEEQIYRWVMPEVRFLFRLDWIFEWKHVVIIILGVVAVHMLMQALVLRYGMKVYWGIWFVWMLLAYTPNLLSKDSAIVQKGMAFVGWVIQIAAEFGRNFWTLIGLGVFGGLVGIAWIFLRKQQVMM